MKIKEKEKDFDIRFKIFLEKSFQYDKAAWEFIEVDCVKRFFIQIKGLLTASKIVLDFNLETYNLKFGMQIADSVQAYGEVDLTTTYFDQNVNLISVRECEYSPTNRLFFPR